MKAFSGFAPSYSRTRVAAVVVIGCFLSRVLPWLRLMCLPLMPRWVSFIGSPMYPFGDTWDNKAFIEHWRPAVHVDMASDIRVRNAETVTADDLIECVEKRACVLHWKQFLSPDFVQQYARIEPGHFVNASYPFFGEMEKWQTNRPFAERDLYDTMVRMRQGERIYMGFNSAFAEDNVALWNGIASSLEKVNEKVHNMFNASDMMTHSFLYYGNAFQIFQHQAFSPDFSVQMSNSKIWRFVHPRHTPRMRSTLGDGPGVLFSLLPYVGGTDIPFTEVVAGPGDLLYFPEHWWHEVHNVEPEGFGLMVGFRSISSKFLFGGQALASSWPMFAHKISSLIHMKTTKFNKDGPEVRKWVKPAAPADSH